MNVGADCQHDYFQDVKEGEINDRVDFLLVGQKPVIAGVVCGVIVGRENGDHKNYEHEPQRYLSLKLSVPRCNCFLAG